MSANGPPWLVIGIGASFFNTTSVDWEHTVYMQFIWPVTLLNLMIIVLSHILRAYDLVSFP